MTETKNRGRVLIIDDDPALAKLLKEALKYEGYEAFRSLGGEEGIKSAKIIKPHVIVLDVMMPGKDGFEVAKVLKEDPLTSNIPILMLTARSRTEDVLTGTVSGASRYVTKPFDLNQLLDEIEALMEWESDRGIETSPPPAFDDEATPPASQSPSAT